MKCLAFKLNHIAISCQVSRKDFEQILDNLPFVTGMQYCIKKLKQLGAELVVISDANTYFIRHVLNHHGVYNQMF